MSWARGWRGWTGSAASAAPVTYLAKANATVNTIFFLGALVITLSVAAIFTIAVARARKRDLDE